MSATTEFLQQHLLSCPTKKYLHIECPGCGFQRSFVALLEGEPGLSFKLYPALLPLLGLWIFVVLHLVFRFKNGAFIIKYLFLFCALIILVNYVLRIINQSAFG
jgi:hypothetical protein